MTEQTPGPPALIGWVDPAPLVETKTWAAEADESEDLDDALLAAFGQCVDFLNGREEPRNPAEAARWRLAQTMQARALIRAQVTGADSTQGMDGMSVTVFPMDWTVKNLLRPRRGVRGPR